MANFYQAQLADGHGKLFTQVVSFRKKKNLQGDWVDYIRIETPGNRDVFEGALTPVLKERYSRQFNAYLEKGEGSLLGTPLDEVGGFEVEFVQELAARKIYTLEQLAAATESQIPSTPEFKQLQKKAQALLQAQEDSKLFDKLKLENVALIEELTELRREIASIREDFGASPEAKTERKSRKGKSSSETN